jgi:hypothetical protein
MNASDLKTQVHKEFDSAPRPDFKQIAIGECACGCYEEARTTYDQITKEVPIEILENISMSRGLSLAFLTPDAVTYFFPILMFAALDNPESLTAVEVFNHLVADKEALKKFFSHLSIQQKRTLFAYLKFVVEEQGQMITQRHLDSRLKFWEEFTHE